MHVSFGVVEGYPAVAAAGRLTLHTTPLLRDALLKAAAEQPEALVCDLRTTEADPAALTVLPAVADLVQDWPTVPLVALSASAGMTARLERLGVTRRVPATDHPDELGALVRRCPGLLRATTRLPATVDSPAVARSFVEETLRRWQVTEYSGVAQLIADELATNAVVQTGRSATLRTSLTGTRIGIAVADRGPDPASGATPPAPSGGWGLVLVEELSDRWGVLPRVDGGHVTWAALGSARSRFTAVPAQTGATR